jgi:23S rRNA (cytidine1920-2'-O)/16S rRNA (cytidine1409-2'-O)-methyltransferase
MFSGHGGHTAQKKCRADVLVAAQGLADSVAQALRLIMAGRVAYEARGGLIAVDKPGMLFAADTRFALSGGERFVSRGAYKLLTALDRFGIDVSGRVCLDAGASTGGFTDCLLRRGAARVYAVDVGRGLLHERLRADNRVVNLEGINLRLAPADLIREPVDLIVADVSFISLAEVIPPCLPWLAQNGRIVPLIKPQFELGSRRTCKGVVRDPLLRQQAVDQTLKFFLDIGLHCRGVTAAGIRGAKGNQEYLACLERGPEDSRT